MSGRMIASLTLNAIALAFGFAWIVGPGGRFIAPWTGLPLPRWLLPPPRSYLRNHTHGCSARHVGVHHFTRTCGEHS